MADFTMLDTEFTQWSPTYVDKGGNPTTTPPAGATAAYSTDNPGVLLLQFTSPDGGVSPDLNPDGSQGTYIGSGSIGTATVTVTGGGTASGFPAESASVEVTGTEAGSFNMTFGTPKTEGAPPAPARAARRA